MLFGATTRMNWEHFSADLANGEIVPWIVLLMMIGGVCHTLFQFYQKMNPTQTGE